MQNLHLEETLKVSYLSSIVHYKHTIYILHIIYLIFSRIKLPTYMYKPPKIQLVASEKDLRHLLMMIRETVSKNICILLPSGSIVPIVLFYDTLHVFKNKFLTKVNAQTNGRCHENRCIKRLSHLTVSLYQLGLFSPSECPGLCRHVDIEQGIHQG